MPAEAYIYLNTSLALTAGRPWVVSAIRAIMVLAVHVSPSRKDDSAVASIWRMVSKQAGALVLLNAGLEARTLYCIHSITGDITALQTFAETIGDYRVFGIQVPKDKMNAAFAASIEGMAREYVDLLTAFQPKGAIALAGWSVGAVIALEMAQQLRARGRDVPLLVALDGAPCNTGAGLKAWNPLYLLKILANVPLWIKADLREDWSLGGFARRIEYKLAFKLGIGGSRLAQTQTLDADRVKTLLHSHTWSTDQKSFIHALYKATANYVPRAYAGRVLVYETRTQPLYHLRQIGAAWKKIAPFTQVVRLDGNHSEIARPHTLGIIARHLGETLSEMWPSDTAACPRIAPSKLSLPGAMNPFCFRSPSGAGWGSAVER